MAIARLCTALILAIFAMHLEAQSKEQRITITGTLVRAMAIGGESTGWTIEPASETIIDGKKLNSIQISYNDTSRLEQLENKRVTATGTVAYRHGVETGDQPVLHVSSIKEAKAATQPARGQKGAFHLNGSEWLLQDLGGGGVLGNVQATLAFPEAAKVAGNASCNRFFGAATITGDAIKLGPLGSTRMACPEAVLTQETKYLNALQGAERFAWKDPYLLIFCKGLEKPLRFTRTTPKAAAP
jgi:heat shock protein HslJ